ncbi:TetR/AcrR family transcriptional regulator [Parafrigoribacterium soli]|uniref:TetR/AcrR family transcriptional regulator n=1 Tax=Parafrigoribacterium soli TaxID=3144663 RepID=UPI0032ED69F7
MNLRSSTVKPTRPYVSPQRGLQAQTTRALIVSTAEALFLRDGFAGTTVAAIASAAGVSVETIYKAFGGKAGMIRAICEKGLAGSGSIPAETRSDELQHSARDPRSIIEGWGLLTAEVSPLVAPTLLLLRDAAATDSGMAELLEELSSARLARMTRNASTLAAAGHLRAGITVDHAAEVLWTYSSPELYELLVMKRGWSLDRYGSFIAEAMIAALLRECHHPQPSPAE